MVFARLSLLHQADFGKIDVQCSKTATEQQIQTIFITSDTVTASSDDRFQRSDHA